MSDVGYGEEGGADSLLRRFGMRAWMVVGISIVVVIVYLALAAVSGIVVPTIVAVVIAMLCGPLVDLLSKHMPRPIAALLVLGGLVAIGVLVIAVAVVGIFDQASLIGHQLTNAFDVVSEWLEGFDVDLGGETDGGDDFGRLMNGTVSGLASYATTAFSSAASFIAGTLISIFILYYVLLDAERLRRWVGTHLGLPADLGLSIVDDVTRLNQEYFYALTISGFLTGVIIGLAVWMLGVPLAFTIGLVTFLTSYVPFLGAIFSGAFAFLIALGSGDFGVAFIVLAIILVVQNVVQPLVQAKLNRDRIDLHPVATFASTIIGGVVAGLLGAALSAPTLAMIISTAKRVRAYEGAGVSTTDDESGA